MSDGFNHPNNQDAYAELDQTLRRMAHAPIPEGLEERVKARLASAPRTGRLLAWPTRHWMRTAAAAAIAAVVAGGGWSVYSRVVRPLANTDLAAPIHALWTGPAMPGGGFSSAGAMRVPLTVNGPTVNHAAKNTGKKHASKLKSNVQAAAK